MWVAHALERARLGRRHPNYFGDCVIWVSYWLLAVAHDRLAALLVGAPTMMYILLRYVSGVELLDKEMVSRKPQYKDYVANVSPFFPWPQRTKGHAKAVRR